MKRFLVSLAMLVVSATVAFADPVRIGAGVPGKGYDRYAQSLVTSLRVARIDAEVKNFAGSEEIATAICKGEADLGPMQIDAFWSASQGCNLDVIGFYGAENAFLLFPPGSHNSKLSHLGPNTTVLADNLGSGSAFFWKNLKSLDRSPEGDQDDWSLAKTENRPFETAPGLAAAKKIDALIMVTSPDSAVLKNLLMKGWTVGTMNSDSAWIAKVNDEEVYKEEKVKVQGYGKVWTYRVESIVAASPELSLKLPTADYNKLISISTP